MRRHPHRLALVLVLAGACRVEPTVGSFLDATIADATVADATPASVVVTAGGPGADVARSIALDRDGNIYLAGSYSGTAQFGAHALSATHAHESFVAKLDPRGKFLWVRAIGGTAKERPQALALDRDGNPHVVAAFGGTLSLGKKTHAATGPADLVVAKLDPDGQVLRSVSAPRGVHDLEDGIGIAVDGAGRTTISGGYWSTARFGSKVLTSAGLEDVFVARLDPQEFAWVWAATAGGKDADRGNAVAVDETGSSFVAGFFSGEARFGETLLDAGRSLHPLDPLGAPQWGCFVAKLDAGGSIVRASPVISASGFSATTSACNALAIGKGGTLAVTGSAGSAPFVAQLQPDGTIAWITSEGFPDGDGRTPKRGNGIALDAAGAMRVAGSLAPYNSLTSDVLVAGLDPAGTVRWSLLAGGAGEDFGNAIALDAAGAAYVAGSFSKAARFGDETVQSAGGSDAFVWKVKAP